MTRRRETLISILGSSYFQPIANLVERWTALRPTSSSRVQSGYFEHGYAASVILLLVAMFESYVVRLRYVQDKKVPVNARSALDVVFSLYPRLRHKRALVEVYVLRDAIFHNHLWEVEYSWGHAAGSRLHSATRHPAFGDRKYSARVDSQRRKTKTLGLNVVPTRIDRRDAVRVFEVLWKTLLRFQNDRTLQGYVSHEHVRYRGGTRLFADVIRELGGGPTSTD
jgi:hypothetical protein